MKKYIIRRLLLLIPILLGITFLSFAMMRIAGSDAVLQKADASGMALSQEVIDAQRAELGLDQPFLTQYFRWLGGFLTGDLGYQLCLRERCVFHVRIQAAGDASAGRHIHPSDGGDFHTSGILAAVKQNKFTDYLIRACSFIGNSLPNFFVALVLMYLLAICFPVFPVISDGLSLESAALPTLTLAIAMSAKYLRQVRAAVLEELGKDYVTGAKARGVRFSVTLWKSVLRSCLVTILTLLALSLGSLLGGTAIVESIFMWDGVGKLAVDAISMRDYPSFRHMWSGWP